MMTRLADRIAEFHVKAERVRKTAPGTHPGEVIEQLYGALRRGSLGDAQSDAIDCWEEAARAELAAVERLLALRARHGWVRRCHGDLHLANVCMFEGELTPFDAIEFNDELANIDVLYDIAFLLMDLARLERDDLSSLVLNRYLSITRDYAGAGLLRLFQSMRAAVRAMVLSLPSQPDAARAKAKRYLDLAVRFLAPLDAPRLIAIGGYSGTGKSTIAALLAPQLQTPYGAILIQSDVIRKRLAGAAPETRLDEDAYAPAITEAVYRRMFKDARRAYRAGRTVILDATFLDETLRRSAHSMADRLGATLEGVWLTADEAVLRQRVSNRAGGASDATIAILERQLQTGAPPSNWFTMAAERAPETLATEIRGGSRRT
jgi:predicted kinase